MIRTDDSPKVAWARFQARRKRHDACLEFEVVRDLVFAEISPRSNGRKRPGRKTVNKLSKGCYFCPERDVAVLDTHRIESGGVYQEWNELVLCATCHRRVTAGRIVVDRKLSSTKGIMLRFFVDGEERIAPA